MKKKIIGICICILMITTMLPMIEAINMNKNKIVNLETFDNKYGDSAIQLTNDLALDSAPCWSPCEWICFVSNRTGYPNTFSEPEKTYYYMDIWIMDSDGNYEQEITHNEARTGYDISWANGIAGLWTPPPGYRPWFLWIGTILYCQTGTSFASWQDAICKTYVFIVLPFHKIFHTGVQPVFNWGTPTPVNDSQAPDFHFTGDKFCFDYCYNFTAGSYYQIFSRLPSLNLPPYQITNFSNHCVFPDSNPIETMGWEIAFMRYNNTYNYYDIYSAIESSTPVNETSPGVRKLIDNGYYPAYSPDGKVIAFASDRSGNWDIWIISADGTGSPLQITTDSHNDTLPTWSPDGKWIAFASDRSGNWDIWKIEVPQPE